MHVQPLHAESRWHRSIHDRLVWWYQDGTWNNPHTCNEQHIQAPVQIHIILCLEVVAHEQVLGPVRGVHKLVHERLVCVLVRDGRCAHLRGGRNIMCTFKFSRAWWLLGIACLQEQLSMYEDPQKQV